ncbi:MAG: twin-arginine translocase TatA/TatE family subunit [Rhodobacteraceae bacterium]|nr:twin-arginine translocase TatA/TatE family subunit [Paracoccaceae bacterium]
MGSFSIMHILVVGIVVLVLFGKGKVSSLMGEVGKGITAFKKGVSEGTAEIERETAESAKDVTPAADKDKA